MAVAVLGNKGLTHSFPDTAIAVAKSFMFDLWWQRAILVEKSGNHHFEAVIFPVFYWEGILRMVLTQVREQKIILENFKFLKKIFNLIF